MKRLLSLLLVFLASAALAESGAYRVEVIVFRNLAVTAQATPVGELRSFSKYPDLVESMPDQVTAEPGNEPPAREPEAVEPTVPLPRFDLPDDLLVVSEKSREMDDAWRRLRGSRDYRPLLYAVWEQNRVDYYPPLRVHGPELIETQLRPQGDIMIADLTAADPLADYRVAFYRLDGSVQLRRSRFLHLFLDIEYRETGPWPAPEPAPSGGTFELQPAVQNEPYTVFTLQQNRQVRTGRMQYFDTPQFGALVLVTAVAPEATQEPTPSP